MYEYKCKVASVYDGDSITLDVDLGFHITHQIKTRLFEIDTPEIRGEEREDGLAAKQYVHQWFERWGSSDDPWPFVVTTHKTGKYGRWLVDIRPVDSTPAYGHKEDPLEIPSLVDSLKAAGHDTEDWRNW